MNHPAVRPATLNPLRATLIAWALALATRALLGCSAEASEAAAESNAPREPDAQPPAAASTVVPAPTASSGSAEGAGEILISAVGDCTLGDPAGTELAPGSFHRVHEESGGDLARPFSGVVDVFARDDLTIANLETTLTTTGCRTDLPFAFRGKPEFATMLAKGSVELVSIANNHIADCGKQGERDTRESLERAGVAHFGLGQIDRRTLKGIEVVNLGYTGGHVEVQSEVERAIRAEKRPDNLVLVSFHWGIEDEHATNDVQHKLGRAAVDAGADLVLGHHPHVLQAIEDYKGKKIVYSLGNFVFGGSSKPHELDSMIFQARFRMTDGIVVPVGYEVLPVSVSGDRVQNDFRPIFLQGEAAAKVHADIERYGKIRPGNLIPAAGP